MSCLKETRAILILGDSGNRILSRYYDNDGPWLDSVKKQKEFEKTLCKKTNQKSSILIHSGVLVVVEPVADVFFYVVGSMEANELILKEILDILLRSLSPSVLAWDQIDTKSLLEHFNCLVLILDELVSQTGIILEDDTKVIIDRVQKGTKIASVIQLPEKTTILKTAFKIANW